MVPNGVVIMTAFSGETSMLYPTGRKEVNPLSSDGCPWNRRATLSMTICASMLETRSRSAGTLLSSAATEADTVKSDCSRVILEVLHDVQKLVINLRPILEL